MNSGEFLAQYIYPIFSVFVVILNVVSVSILMYGSAIATFRFVKSRLHHLSPEDAALTNNKIKNNLASYILLSLEVLIASDIIESVIHPTLQDLTKLGFLVIIRTAISYFLNREISQEE